MSYMVSFYTEWDYHNSGAVSIIAEQSLGYFEGAPNLLEELKKPAGEQNLYHDVVEMRLGKMFSIATIDELIQVMPFLVKVRKAYIRRTVEKINKDKADLTKELNKLNKLKRLVSLNYTSLPQEIEEYLNAHSAELHASSKESPKS